MTGSLCVSLVELLTPEVHLGLTLTPTLTLALTLTLTLALTPALARWWSTCTARACAA